MTAPTSDGARRAHPAGAPAHAPAPATEPQPRHLRVVPEGYRTRRARRRRARLLAFSLAVLVSAGLFGLVAAHVVLTQGQFQIDRLGSQLAEEQARQDRLRLQVARLESPERVVAVAQSRLGMVPPPGVTYLSPSGATDQPPRVAAVPAAAPVAPKPAVTAAKPAPAKATPAKTTPTTAKATSAKTTPTTVKATASKATTPNVTTPKASASTGAGARRSAGASAATSSAR